MKISNYPYRAYLSFAAVLCLTVILLAGATARSVFAGSAFGNALVMHFMQILGQPISTTILLFPFLILGWISGSLAEEKGFKYGAGVLSFGTILLAFIYFAGFHNSYSYMARQMYTAAALSIGLVPVKSIPLLLICLGLRWLVSRRLDSREHLRRTPDKLS